MKAEFIESLLYESEGPTLDFKRDQYPFSKATEEEKSELLKDILGFANCWRRTDAFILIGVEEVQGGQGIIKGVAEHLADHSLQQFVNNLTNRPIQFGYEACEIGGNQIGIIRIELQRRPIFLKHDYGKLKKGLVYVRRGSSTDPSKPADADEIALMGSANHPETSEASLQVEFASPVRELSLGVQMQLSGEYCEMPNFNEIPLLDDRPKVLQLPGGRSFQMPSLSDFDPMSRLNEDFYHELANFEFLRRLAKETRLVITNTGDIPANDVQIEIIIPKGNGIAVLDSTDIPAKPTKREDRVSQALLKKLKPNPAFRKPGYVEIETNDDRMKIHVNCGNLQPGRKVWTESFFVGTTKSGEVAINGQLYAANLSKPQEFSLGILADILQTAMTLDELVALGDTNDDEE
jgi:hypothetical protein